MRKWVGLALIVPLLVGGCASSAAPSGSATNSQASGGASAHRIAFFVPWTEDVWYVVAINGAKKAAADIGIQLDVYDASNKLEQQIQQMDTAIASKPEAILLSSVDPAGMVPSVEKAHDAGIKVIAYDRPIYATTKLDGLVVLDTKNMGEMSAKWAVDALTKKYGTPKGTIIRAYGDLADTWVTGISSGFDPYMAKYPDIKVLKAVSGQWDPTQSAANVQQLLAANSNIDGIVLDSDWLGTGIVTALQSGGYGKVGTANHVFLLGNGGMKEGLQAIRDGWMDATVYNPVPDFTNAAVHFANMIATGQKLPGQWAEEGKKWSPATIFNATPADKAPYAGPVLNMPNFVVDPSTASDPTLWGNAASK